MELAVTPAHPRARKRFWALAGGLLLLGVVLLFSICQGAAVFSPLSAWQILSGGAGQENFTILYHIRLPRLITGALTGVNLALAGCILQGILRNPLADPGIIGV